MDMRFERLVRRGVLTAAEMEAFEKRAQASGKPVEEILLLEKGVPKREILFSLSEYYNCPYEEYEETLMASYFITMRLEMEKLKKALWFPLSLSQGRAEVIAYRPGDECVMEDIRKTLKVEEIDFRVALSSDLVRIIENNFDANPCFPGFAGRTPLALVRTALAYRRSTFAHYRTLFAKGRTGLAFIRTGVSFTTISLLFIRIFGMGLFAILEIPLLLSGIVLLYDGIKWYLPSRKIAGKPVDSSRTESTWGTTVLQARTDECPPSFGRSCPVGGAEALRNDWINLSPVMRRRFLASDRTDMAEERTALAGSRTRLAKARTGLAFTRTGIALIGLGTALIRQFHSSRWTILDLSLIAAGILMSAEGLHWYFGGRRAGSDGFSSVLKMNRRESIWDFVFPLGHKLMSAGRRNSPPVRSSDAPGIWATTGLALERTVLADRRCLMARLRTVMAVSRTGLAFVRTGMSIIMVGAGLLVYFGVGKAYWTVFDIFLIVAGIYLIADGTRWMAGAERMRTEYPYCYGDMEINIPDYGKPVRRWGKVIFGNEN